jgi:valyl-tRNA synthetase
MAMPEKPSIDGLELKWGAHWQEQGTYTFDRSRQRGDIYAIDTPPPTVSGSLHMGSFFGYVQVDAIARFQRISGACYRLVFARPGGEPVEVETTRPELLPAYVALVAHPDDERGRICARRVSSPSWSCRRPPSGRSASSSRRRQADPRLR